MSARVLVTLAIAVATLAGCAVYYGQRLDQLYGPADPARYDRPLPDDDRLSFRRDVKPVLDGRCTVCHGCNDAPCQLNMASHEGMTRGASKDIVYDASRLKPADPTRLFLDAQSNAEWRKRGFYPVLNERAMTPVANREASVLYRLLRLKQQHPGPDGGTLPANRFDFSLDRAQQCPSIEQMDGYERAFPEWGMPFGLPALSAREHDILTRWVEAGAPYRDPPPLSGDYLKQIAAWERFMNGDAPKIRLMSRYIYEHWFIVHLYFDDLPGDETFQLVRSRTPPGQPVDVIATRRPFDDPGVARVYYRLRRNVETPLAKTRMPIALNAARMARLKTWFLDAPYDVAALPSYSPEVASNPFVAFRELPVVARYRFMLDDAQITLMGFIKGPVCRGQLALNVITDHFWVFFSRPDGEGAELDAEFLAREARNLRLPAEHESAARLLAWLQYDRLESDFLSAKIAYLKQRFGAGNAPTLATLWDGDGRNPNAALTVFRHFDSASVVQGLLGEQPQTVLVLGYPLFERIHYLLVAGYDVYGNAGHQLATRMYFDFMRMEGEMNFLGFLPRAARQAVRDRWYRGASSQHSERLRNVEAFYGQETGISFKSADPLAELYAMLKSRMATLSRKRYALARSGLTGAPLATLSALSGLRGRPVSHLPEASFLTVRDAAGGSHHFTMLLNTAHSNVAELLGDEARRLPEEDDLLIVSGFIGAYPNAMFAVNADQLPDFAEAVRSLGSEDDYRRLSSRYGVRRTDQRFWALSDGLHLAYRRWAPREAGLFDYNRFENR